MKHLPVHPTKRHPLTGKPLTAVGFSRRGPIWPIIGASEDDDAPDETPDDADDKADEDKPDEHRQARQEAIKSRRELKPWKEIAKDFDLTPAQVREALAKSAKPGKAEGDDDKPEEIDADEIRRQAKAEARQESDARIVRSEVRALAAETFTSPADALHNLSLDDYEVDENGELVDAKRVKEDLAQVLKDNPHYSKTGKRPKADPSQGPKGDQKPDPGPGIARLRHAYDNPSK